MSKSVSIRLIWFWEKGYLYIAIACLIHFVWFLSDNVGMLDWIKEIAYFEALDIVSPFQQTGCELHLGVAHFYSTCQRGWWQ